MKRLIVIALERICDLIDRLSWFGLLGYSCQLARWSAALDDRWETEVWV